MDFDNAERAGQIAAEFKRLSQARESLKQLETGNWHLVSARVENDQGEGLSVYADSIVGSALMQLASGLDQIYEARQSQLTTELAGIK